MKKEMEIWLNPEEIQQLLEGGLYWKDIEPKLSPENAEAFKRQISLEDDLDITSDSSIRREFSLENDPKERQTVFIKESDEDNGEVRAILLGDLNLAVKNWHNNSSGVQDEQGATFVQHAATIEENGSEIIEKEESPDDIVIGEEILLLEKDQDKDETIIRRRLFDLVTDEETGVGFEEKNRFSDMKAYEDTREIGRQSNSADSSTRDTIFDEEIEPEDKTSLGGLKILLLLVISAVLTFGFWYYFLFH